MKTRYENEGIQRFCAGLSGVLSDAGIETCLLYDGHPEFVKGSVNGIDVDISVWGDNVEAAARDIIRGVQAAF